MARQHDLGGMILNNDTDKVKLQEDEQNKTAAPKSNLLRRMATTFATQTLFLGISLVALNFYHGKFDLSHDISQVPWWHLFLCFGMANICAQVVLNRVGFDHIFVRPSLNGSQM